MSDQRSSYDEATAPARADHGDGHDVESPTVRTRPNKDENADELLTHAGSPSTPEPAGDETTTTVRPSPKPSPRPSPGPSPAAKPPPRPFFTSGDDATERLPTVNRPPAGTREDQATAMVPQAAALSAEATTAIPGATEQMRRPPRPPSAPAGGTGRFGRKRVLMVAGAVAGVLALLYVGDLALGSGSVPRGVSVAGIPVGGMELAAAEQQVRSTVESRTDRPIPVAVGDGRGEIDPEKAGLAVDWPATMERAGDQPLNPITRITSFFTEREAGVVSATDRAALTSAFDELAPVVDKEPVEGTVKFEDLEPVAVNPVPGQRLDVTAALSVMEQEWVYGREVSLPVTTLPPSTGPEDVTAAIDQLARPAVEAPITLIGEKDTKGEITPEVMAESLVFKAEGGELKPEINPAPVEEALDEAMSPSEVEGRDATIDFAGGAPKVVPSQHGRGIDYPATLAALPDLLKQDGPRELTAIYSDQPAEVTTEEIEGMGIKEMVSEFTTGGFAADSGHNIRTAAKALDGTVVPPGGTFSLTEQTGPRNASNGYIEAGVIQDGEASRGIAGGVSQVATTTYNAAYFAGMTDVQHREHSFYISRYPAGREATVVEGALDLKWRNDSPTGILVKTYWTPSSLTVRLYGTKTYEVTSTPGERFNPTEPNTITRPAGPECKPGNGAPGFSITDTRTIRNLKTGTSKSEKRTVKYNPVPKVVCEG